MQMTDLEKLQAFIEHSDKGAHLLLKQLNKVGDLDNRAAIEVSINNIIDELKLIQEFMGDSNDGWF